MNSPHVLLVNGSPHREGCTYTALKEVADTLEANGVSTLVDKMTAADGLVLGSPVHFAAASGQLTTACDRLFMADAALFRGKPGAAVVSCRRFRPAQQILHGQQHARCHHAVREHGTRTHAR